MPQLPTADVIVGLYSCIYGMPCMQSNATQCSVTLRRTIALRSRTIHHALALEP